MVRLLKCRVAMQPVQLDLVRSAAGWREAMRDTWSSWREMGRGGAIAPNVFAGVTVAFVALPLNLALAMACGLPPAAGLVTGILAGVVAGLFGGAKLQISGPEVALAPLTYEIVSRHGLKGLLVATFLAGLLQVAFGLLRVGRFVHAIPRPVIGGFLAAVGLLVLDAQLPRLLGLPAEVRLLSAVSPHDALARTDWVSLVLGAVVMACFVLMPRLSPRVPGALVGLAVVAAAIWLVGASLPTVGALELGRLAVVLPDFGAVGLAALLPEALALALLASIDSLMSAVSVDAVTRARRHHSDQELVAQGVANVLSSLVGGMPVAGAVVRSMAAVQAGATTRLTSLSHAGALLGLLVVAAPLVAVLPLTGLAGILVVVGVRLVNWRELRFTWRASPLEGLAFVVTAASILVGDFVQGVATGLVVSLVHFAVQHSRLGLSAQPARVASPGLAATTIVEINGPIFFASHAQLEALASQETHHALVLDLRAVPMVDLTGAEALRMLVERLGARGTRVLAVGARAEVAARLASGGVVPLLFGQRVFPGVDAALDALHAQEATAPRADSLPGFQLGLARPAPLGAN